MVARIALGIAIVALLLSCLSIYLGLTLSGPIVMLDPNAPSEAPLTAPPHIDNEQAAVCRDILTAPISAEGRAAMQRQKQLESAWEKARCDEFFGRVGSE